MTNVSSPRWGDDELLHELRAALQELPVDESVIRAARRLSRGERCMPTLSSSAWTQSPGWPLSRWCVTGRARRARWCSTASG
jgi:hypothetical protein